MALDNKYGRVTVEHGTIGEDEPVVVFRAKDLLLLRTLRYYRSLANDMGAPTRHLDSIWDAMEAVAEWQRNNKTQIPQSEGYESDSPGAGPAPDAYDVEGQE